ncbi:cytochrome c oxidase accessory protein [Campylobacter iguaniorum]|uniref:cytochrome c oxidase accessory protein CcoG n=1 Tax=Campylobacter iguaniorum TaxID=1244531 RepID=UPI00073A056C|nr:cytochrome c oxidase accessory protein CcoG [Campylobacter iguaniorum]ALV23751.1 cytochrome c oxidase accessory protein [Campylobacter iguaniorum]
MQLNPNDVLANKTPYAQKRYITYAIVTVIALVLPFIRINDNHFFLLSFDKKQLNLLFTSFDMQELYLMPFLLIIMFLSIFFLTTLGGRVWCGWACPQTVFRVLYRDLIQTKLLGIRKNLRDRQKKFDGNYVKKAIGVILWACLALIAASNFLWYFVPPEDFFTYLSNPSEHKLLVGILIGITAFIVFDVVYLAENFCVYVCPYARIQSVMFDNDTIQVIYDEQRGGKIYDGQTKLGRKPLTSESECIGCEACVHICPTHIDIRKGMQLECINCLECSDACSKVMGNLGKETLISWTSAKSLQTRKPVNYFRFRTIAYMVVIAVAIVALALMTTKKENMLLNINRTTELYKIEVDNGKFNVENAYTFLMQNTQKQEHIYYFDVNDTRIKITRPAAPIKIKAGGKKKVIVVLNTRDTLVNVNTKDTPLDIKINAYALDDKKNISVSRDTIFVFPKMVEIRKALSKD